MNAPLTAYAYRAVHASGRLQKGFMEAVNENDLASMLKSRDLELISATPRSGKSYISPTASITDEERAVFCQQCRDLLKAGLPFAETLHHVALASPRQNFRDRLAHIEKNLLSGSAVTGAFGTSYFDTVTLSILRAGEKHGDLAEAFSRMEIYLRARISFRKQLRRAVRYPLFLLVLALSVTSFMMIFVVPQMVQFLTSLGNELPASTRFLIACADAFTVLWWALPLTGVVVAITLSFLRAHSAAITLATDGVALRLPIIGKLWRKIALARVTNGFSLLLKAGLSLPEALSESAPLASNAALCSDIENAQQKLATGQAFSKVMENLLPALITQHIIIAEKSGTLAAVMDDIAGSLDAEAKESIDTALGLLEPALTLLVGLLLAWIVLAVLGPVYGSLAPLSQGM
ncbi:MAG TPA: hypothetical protein DCY07_01555 [Rhodospirillaceae bacterium]|nr:hypothetical protein [Rhodospirillaceae bacterium]